MLQVQIYSTSGLEPRCRNKCWNGLVCHSVTQPGTSSLNCGDFTRQPRRAAGGAGGSRWRLQGIPRDAFMLGPYHAEPVANSIWLRSFLIPDRITVG